MDSRARRYRLELPEDIVKRLRTGDESAYEQLINTAFTPLTYFAYELVGSYESAEDIVQDVFIKILELGETFEPRGPLPVYLYSAVRNRALNVLRHSAVAQRHVAAALHDEATSSQTSGDQPSFNDIDTYLNGLTERQRTAVYLRFVDQRTVPEISAILQVSQTAVEGLLRRALKTIRESYRPD